MIYELIDLLTQPSRVDPVTESSKLLLLLFREGICFA